MELLLEKPARKGLERMPRKSAEAMLKRLENIAASPRAQHANVKPLVGFKDTYRLRQGDWRAVYRLVYEANQMRVVVVDVRGSIYR
jgi:mRNA-degrading endonuclease RelE of RelBE toxin-antitoxin system